jgi:hypothetical protein
MALSFTWKRTVQQRQPPMEKAFYPGNRQDEAAASWLWAPYIMDDHDIRAAIRPGRFKPYHGVVE